MINSNSAPNLQTSAYDQIRQDIIFCTLIPGQKISVKTMEDNLGIGRTPVREALVRLSQQGLVQTVPQSGTYVSRISLREAENARYVREHLEKVSRLNAARMWTMQPRQSSPRYLPSSKKPLRSATPAPSSIWTTFFTSGSSSLPTGMRSGAGSTRTTPILSAFAG